jgi:TM2 domain-containing membrane protein YozV
MGTDYITRQTTDISNSLVHVKQDLAANERLAYYQTQMYTSMKYVNSFLLLIYIFLFTLIHVLFFEQYMRGIERSEFWDTIWLTVFFLYPYLIYLTEETIYFAITYVLSFIYGESYVYRFDQIMMMTDFYKPPPESS